MFTLVGCSSQPRQVSASLPLVQSQPSPIGDKIPTQYRKELEKVTATQIFHPKYKVVVGPFYLSSLGQDCRELSVTLPDGQQILRVACAESKQYPEQVRAWYLVPNIIQTSSSIQL